MDPSLSLYSPGTLIWTEDPKVVWRLGRLKDAIPHGAKEIHIEVLSIEDKNIVEEDDRLVTLTPGKGLPPLRNPDILIGSNDLTTLSYLHEPAVLYNLRVRFLHQRAIYTWCGIVLVAINPFCPLDIYGDQTIRTYHESGSLTSSVGSQLDPHIYAVAEDAFSMLEREGRNQSIIVSGESGAGKTVSAKYAMRFFASIASSSAPNTDGTDGASGAAGSAVPPATAPPSGLTTQVSVSSATGNSNIEDRVLASNPIMECIGNAKTTRNDNSSRFGKYIQIMMDPLNKNNIVGGNMRTYLLEKSRVSNQSEGERNFHIFYQMCVHAQQKGLPSLGLLRGQRFIPFRYLGGIEPCPTNDDPVKFLEAMNILAFPDRYQGLIVNIVAAILHAGDITFRMVSEEECEVDKHDVHLTTFCNLLRLDEEATCRWLTRRVLRTGVKEVIQKPMDQEAARNGRDALAKYLYEKMFSWIVSLINKALGVSNKSLTSTFIGVLDIYGFEHFEINSFEQFSINYANEVLQQQFNQHVFKLEQEEYVKEGIDWTFIQFTDNHLVIDLIESKMGILSLLDEECRMPRGTDESWCHKLYQELPKKEGFKTSFEKPKIGSSSSFIIQHFADKVIYTVTGFLDKNRDTVWEEQIDLLKRSTSLEGIFSQDFSQNDGPVIKPQGKTRITAGSDSTGGSFSITSASTGSSVGANSNKAAKATVGTQFKESLAALMKILNSTTPHYVRCIKSNDDKEPFQLDNVRAVQQLRACGVLETIRISCNGFPSRWTYQDFSGRYRVLLVGAQRFVKKKVESEGGPPVPLPRKLIKSGASTAQETRAVCEQIVKLVYDLQIYSSTFGSVVGHGEQTLYQFGKGKIFFRAGQVALLERIRTTRLRECAILIQKTVKGWLEKKRFLRMKRSAILIQSTWRRYQAKKRVQEMRQTQAVIVIQKYVRSYQQKRRYKQILKSTQLLQRYGRGLVARRDYRRKLQERAALTIQRVWRGYQARKWFQLTIKRVVIVQSLVRRFLARKLFKRLKIEAKSVQHVTQLNKGLEKKIIELQQKLNETRSDLKEEKKNTISIQDMKADLVRLDIELKNFKNLVSDRDLTITQLQDRLIKEEIERDKVIKDLESKKVTISKLKDLKKELDTGFDQRAIDEAVERQERMLKAQFDQERKAFFEDLEHEKHAHQQLLRRFTALEDRVQHSSTGDNGFDGSEGDSGLSSVSLMMRCSELEQELNKIKHENQEMREVMANLSRDSDGSSGVTSSLSSMSTAQSLLANQYASIQAELDRTREEKTQLKTIVLGQESGAGKAAESEVMSAFKQIIKQLEREVDQEKIKSTCLSEEVGSCKREIDRQRNLIGLRIKEHGDKTGEGGDFFQHMNTENQYLKEQVDQLKEEVKRLRMSHKRSELLAESEAAEAQLMSQDPNAEYMGMLEYEPNNIQVILNHLITTLDPRSALKLKPHLPAFLMFMLIRYTDYKNDDDSIKVMLNHTILNIKKVGKAAIVKQEPEPLILWLSNTAKLGILLKQYSGEDRYGIFEESFVHFDLSEYRDMFAEVSVWLARAIIKIGEERVHPLIVPAILETQGLNMTGYSHRPQSHRTGSFTGTNDSLPTTPSEKPMDDLIQELSNLQKLLCVHSIEPDMLGQIFLQLFYFICAGALNNLLLRKDLCHWDKGMQIRFNLSHLEQWAREQQLPMCNLIVEKLEPIIQATKLLQTNKNDEIIPSIVEMCHRLTSTQIVKILSLYTAGDEEVITPYFLKSIKAELEKSRPQETSDCALLMDTKKFFPLSFPYKPSEVDFRKITLPPLLIKKGLAVVLNKV